MPAVVQSAIVTEDVLVGKGAVRPVGAVALSKQIWSCSLMSR